MRAAAAALFAGGAAGHGAVTTPPPRNAGGAAVDPARPGCYGGACDWYDVGCSTGCDACSHHVGGEGRGGGPVDIYTEYTPAGMNCTVAGAPVPPGLDVAIPGTDTLPAAARTWNIGGRSPRGDYARFMPWRAPGTAPLGDPCGLLCEHCHDGGLPPLSAGSLLPRLAGVNTTWAAGARARVGFALKVNHGGGWQYRVCPRAHAATEACFQAGVLDFATQTTSIEYLDGSRAPFDVPALDVSAGTVPKGSTWRRNPVPACGCDAGGGCGSSAVKFGADWTQPYDTQAQGPPGCPRGLQFPAPWVSGYGFESGMDGGPEFNFQLVDTVVAPATPGEYLLQWRWDTEQGPQVWANCADITVV